MLAGSATRRGFTLIELMAVVVILAVLAGVALPRFFDYSATAKASACKGALGGLRAGIANFYADKAINSATARYPTLVELTTAGTVMQTPLPENPYNASNLVTSATYADSTTSPRPLLGAAGWRYYAGNTSASPATVWANSDVANENDF